MSIVSFYFFAFIGIVYAAYWLCVPKLRWMVLLFASAYFMLFSTQFHLGLCSIFAAEALLVWFAAIKINKLEQERSKTWLQER